MRYRVDNEEEPAVKGFATKVANPSPHSVLRPVVNVGLYFPASVWPENLHPSLDKCTFRETHRGGDTRKSTD
jgi:hypothetical protein